MKKGSTFFRKSLRTGLLMSLSISGIGLTNQVNAQCLTSFYGEYPSSPYTPTCNGSIGQITDWGYAGEYSRVELEAGVAYTFSSSINSDLVTISDENGSTALAFGTGSVTYTASTSAVVRFYTHLNDGNCGDEDEFRSRNVLCGTPPPPPPNDLPASAILISVDQACSSASQFTNVGATVSVNEPGIPCIGPDRNAIVWFKFVAPVGGGVQVSTDYLGGTLTDTRVALYSATNVSDFSTFTVLGCDEDNGVLVDYNSIFYAAGLTPGSTYYVAIDRYDQSGSGGTFCLTVKSITSSMMASSVVACDQGLSGFGYGESSYKGWTSLLDDSAKLIANLKPSSGNPVAFFDISPSYTVNSGAIRTDGANIPYMDRNIDLSGDFYDDNFSSIPSGNFDLQLFFKQSELTALGTSISSLNVTHDTSSSVCNANFSGQGTTLLQTANNSNAEIGWIQTTTPSFSNFYIMAGTVALPVNLARFDGHVQKASNVLDWTVNAEHNVKQYILERANRAGNFEAIGMISAKNEGANKYQYIDHQPLTGSNEYRLRMVDQDGSYALSEVVKLNNAFGTTRFSALPNPVKGALKVTIAGNIEGNASVSIVDLAGRIVYSQDVHQAETNIDMSAFAPGVYFVKFEDGQSSEVIKVSKN